MGKNVQEMKLLTEIQIFNKVVKHLLTQKSSSKDKECCLYRSKNGKSCAVGCLIKNKYYNESIEDVSVEGLNHEILYNSGIPTEESIYKLLKELQLIHDEVHPNAWKQELTLLHSNHFVKPLEESKLYIGKIVKSLKK
jgi:hypothetical protein